MIKHDQNTIRSVPISAALISFLTLFFPFANILPLFFPVQFLGKNIWIVLPVLLIAAMYAVALVKTRQSIAFTKFDGGLFVLALLGALIYEIREALYSDPGSILDVRYIISPLLFLSVFKIFVQGERNVVFVTRAVVLTCLIQAVLGILHAHFFSYININIETSEFVLEAERTREGGTLGASIYANVIVCGMFLIVFGSSRSSRVRYVLIETMATLVMLYAVTLSGSRYPMIVASLLTIGLLSRSLLNWRQMAVLLAVVAIASYFIFLNEEGVELLGIFRLSEDSGGRVDKFITPLMLLSDGLSNFVIGPPSLLTAATFSEDGFGISDNSYMLMALQFGVLFAVSWFTFFTGLLWRNASSYFSVFFIVYLLLGLGVTNSILWEPWTFVAMLSWTIIYKKARFNEPK